MYDRPYRRDIQGLRGIAVLLVVAYHCGLALHGGFIGVDVFFVISGFVIGGLLLAQLDQGGTVSLRDFYARRARRLLPMLAVVTTVTLSIGAVVLSPFGPQQLAARTAAAATAFVANLYLYRHVGYFAAQNENINPFLHMWSLSVEEQFYLGLPVSLALCWRLARRLVGTTHSRRVLGAVVALVCAASLWLSWAATSGRSPIRVQAPARFAFYGAPTRLWEFGAGVLLAIAAQRLTRLPAKAAGALGLAGVALLAWSALTIDPLQPFPGLAAIPPVLGTALLIVAGPGSPATARLVGSRGLAWIGDRSYGWYLWHWPAIVLCGALWPTAGLVPLAAGVLSLPVAAVTYRFVEHPIRIDRAIVGRRALKVGATCLIIPVLALVLVTTGTRHRWGLHEPDGWYDLPEGRNVGCVLFNRDIANTWDQATCTSHVARARGTILLLGDTNADSVSTGLIEAAGRRHLEVAEWARAGCPFSARSPYRYPKCVAWQHAALSLVDRLHPTMVVIANQSPEYTGSTRSDIVMATERGGRPADRKAALDAWRQGLAGVLDHLADRHVPVLIVGPTPDFANAFPRDHLSLIRPGLDPPTITVEQVLEQRQATTDVEMAVVRGRAHVRTLDPIPSLCGALDCPSMLDGHWLYYDRRELTQTGSRRLTGPLGESIDDLLAG